MSMSFILSLAIQTHFLPRSTNLLDFIVIELKPLSPISRQDENNSCLKPGSHTGLCSENPLPLSVVPLSAAGYRDQVYCPVFGS